MNTRDKILLASLELFNEKGERNVTTNHVAAHLGISPGNLYYHFRNKSDIVYEIFLRYRALVQQVLALPEGRPLTLEDQFQYLEAVFEGLWGFRFLHRELEHFLDEDERLRRDYRDFTRFCLGSIREIIARLDRAGVLQGMDEMAQAGFALNVWLVVTNWMAFLKTACADADERIDKDRLRQGIYQVILLQRPFIAAPYREELARRQRAYQPHQWVLDSVATTPGRAESARS